MSVEVFYAVHPSFWGKGLPTEVIAALVKQIFIQSEFTQIEAFVKPGNKASMSVLHNNNFTNRGLVRT